MRLCLCQINTTVGDFAVNRDAIVDGATRGQREGASLAIFPELTVTGYPPRDLLDRPAFIDANLACLRELERELPAEIAVLVGFVDRQEADGRTELYNAAALIRGGKIEQVFHKRLLPSYDVFDEKRYFTSGKRPTCFDLEGTRFGVTLCEDVWNDADSPLRVAYPDNPVAACVDAGADVLLNLAASPFTLAKHTGRRLMFADVASGWGKPKVFVNLVGGNDDILFDGGSTVFAPDGSVSSRAHTFQEQILTVDLEGGSIADAPDSPEAAALEALVMGTRDYAYKCGFKRVVLGLSGGIDSALTAAVACQALGPDNVLGVAMPTRYSSEGSLRDAHELADNLGMGFCEIPIDGMFQGYLDELTPHLEHLGEAPEVDTTFENLQARIRGTTLMAISNRLGHLLLTTGNKSEIAVGYCTLYGDMAGGLAVISDLPKTFVYKVAEEFNRQAGSDLIPRSTIDKEPSAELRPDQRDADSLPPYEVLDAVLEALVEEGLGVEATVARGHDRTVVERVAAMVRNNEYKRRQMPPGLIVTRKAFGPGRRYPIAQRYRA